MQLAMDTGANVGLNFKKPVIAHLMVSTFLLQTSTMLTAPYFVDIFLATVCPGQNECSEVIFLSGGQQMVTHLGVVLLAPVVGGISDDYGRKPVLMTVFLSAIVPSVLIAYSRTKVFVYTWFLISVGVSILREGAVLPTSLAYVADVVDPRHRAPAVGLIISSVSTGFLGGTLGSLLIRSVDQAFWTAVVLQFIAVIYLKLFVRESNPSQLLLSTEISESTTKLLLKPVLKGKSSSLLETLRTIQTSPLLRTIALVEFLNSFAASCVQGFLLYYLKAVFNYGKDEFAEIALIMSLSAVVGQTLLYPILADLLGERRVLWIGLVGTSAHILVYGFAKVWWAPFAAASLGVFPSLVPPAAGTLVSREVEHEQQGKTQGFMGGIRSAAGIIGPVVMTPLTALFLGDNPPFNMRGLNFIIGGAVVGVAVLISFGIPPPVPLEQNLKPCDHIHDQVSSVDFIHTEDPLEDLLQVLVHPDAIGATDEEEDDQNGMESEEFSL